MRRYLLLLLIASLGAHAAQAQLATPQRILAPEYPTSTSFGRALALQDSTLVVGAPDADVNGISEAGQAWIYRLQPDGTWQLGDHLKMDPLVPRAYFGTHVVLADPWLFVSAPIRTATSIYLGQVSVYRRTGTTWAHHSDLTLSIPSPPARPITHIAAHGDVLAITVGRVGRADLNLLCIFDYDGQAWQQRRCEHPFPGQSLPSVAVHEDRVVAFSGGDWQDLQARAKIYARTSDGAWVPEDTLLLGTTQTPWVSVFGSLTADQLFISTPSASVVGPGPNNEANILLSGAGKIQVFTRSEAGTWMKTDEITRTPARRSEGFGTRMTIRGDRMLVQARATEVSNTFVYAPSEDGTWVEDGVLPFPEEPFAPFTSVLGDDWAAISIRHTDFTFPNQLVLYPITPPRPTFSPGAVAFGTHPTMPLSRTSEVTLRNEGTRHLRIEAFDAPEGYRLEHDCPDLLPYLATCDLEVTFAPTLPGTYDSALRLTANTSEAATLPLEARVAPHDPTLLAAYPNPFTEATTVELSLPEAVPATVRVYDTLGRTVRTLSSDVLGPGPLRLRWMGDDEAGRPVPAGVYLIHAHLGARTLTSRVVRL